MFALVLIISLAFAAHGADDLPIVIVDRDNIVITESCIVEIGSSPIEDADGNGVIHIEAADITVSFAEEKEKRELLGAPEGTPWDELTGIGIRIDGHHNVTIRGAHCHRYRIGIYATEADGLVLEGCDVAGGFAQRLKSTPQAEASEDWLWPHENDNREWITSYGAGIAIERSKNVTVRGTFARRRQNGIVLDRVNDSKIFDNDCSFLSGWGLAMWRSNRNMITRNAFDFCVRGYSHGVYNRGQDSAGILMFEQCSENMLVDNSVTHGGDGFFGFAGKDALTEVNPREDLEWYRRRGCNDNSFARNDFSYAVAHGLELTFSFGNVVIGNRFAENAICGIWGGYSQAFWIADNEFIANGDMAYGLERGGINIEHGRGNLITSNHFRDNECGIHLWWDNDQHIFSRPWYKVNRADDEPSFIVSNDFSHDALAVQLRHLKHDALLSANTFTDVKEEISIEGMPGFNPDTAEIEIELPEGPEKLRIGQFKLEIDLEEDGLPDDLPGESRPIGARKHLAGREHIIMTEWFPYDWEKPLAVSDGVMVDDAGDAFAQIRVLNPTGVAYTVTMTDGKGLTSTFESPARTEIEGESSGETSFGSMLHEHSRNEIVHTHRLRADAPGVYRLRASIAGETVIPSASATLVQTTWRVRTFPSPIDPREDVGTWREAANGDDVVSLESSALRFVFGSGGMSDLRETASKLPADHFGVIADTTVPLPAGDWRIRTTSDDGIRVWVDGELVIDDWTWHAPEVHDGVFTVDRGRDVPIRVEYFELDGYATLVLDLQPVISNEP